MRHWVSASDPFSGELEFRLVHSKRLPSCRCRQLVQPGSASQRQRRRAPTVVNLILATIDDSDAGKAARECASTFAFRIPPLIQQRDDSSPGGAVRQTWNIGSGLHWVSGSFGSSFTSGSPDHYFDPV